MNKREKLGWVGTILRENNAPEQSPHKTDLQIQQACVTVLPHIIHL